MFILKNENNIELRHLPSSTADPGTGTPDESLSISTFTYTLKMLLKLDTTLDYT